MVHMKDDAPSPVPPLNPVTDAEIELYRSGEQKYVEIQSKYKKK